MMSAVRNINISILTPLVILIALLPYITFGGEEDDSIGTGKILSCNSEVIPIEGKGGVCIAGLLPYVYIACDGTAEPAGFFCPVDEDVEGTIEKLTKEYGGSLSKSVLNSGLKREIKCPVPVSECSKITPKVQMERCGLGLHKQTNIFGFIVRDAKKFLSAVILAQGVGEKKHSATKQYRGVVNEFEICGNEDTRSTGNQYTPPPASSKDTGNYKPIIAGKSTGSVQNIENAIFVTDSDSGEKYLKVPDKGEGLFAKVGSETNLSKYNSNDIVQYKGSTYARIFGGAVTGEIDLPTPLPESSAPSTHSGSAANSSTGSLPVPAPTTPSLDPLAGSRGSAWGNQDRIASTQGTNPYVNSGYGWGVGERSEPMFGGVFGNLFGDTYAPVPKQPAREARGQDATDSSGGSSAPRTSIAFADIYRMLTSYDRYVADKATNVLPETTQDTNNSTTGGYGQITFQSDQFGEVVAYGVSEEQLREILSDIATRNDVVSTGGLPSVSTDANGDFTISSALSSGGVKDTVSSSVPSWLQNFVLAGGAATTDSSGYYGYVTSPDNKTVDVYEKEEGKLLTLESEGGKVSVGLTNSDGETVFLPRGGVLDAEAAWSEFTRAFVNIAGREPVQAVDSYKIPELSPFDIVVRELYGDEALVEGIPFAPSSPEYTLSKDGELIPVGVIDAAMDVVKERAGVFGLQNSINEVTGGKVQVFTSAVSIPLNTGTELTNIRIMPVPQQLLVLARLKGELEARGHRNVDEAVRTAIFNTYDSTAKKVAGITAFTVRIDEAGNVLGSTRTSYSIASLVSSIFVDVASAVEESMLSKNPIASFLGNIFGSKPAPRGQNGNVYRIKEAREKVQEPQTIGQAAMEIMAEAVITPFKVIGSLLKGMFGK